MVAPNGDLLQEQINDLSLEPLQISNGLSLEPLQLADASNLQPLEGDWLLNAVVAGEEDMGVEGMPPLPMEPGAANAAREGNTLTQANFNAGGDISQLLMQEPLWEWEQPGTQQEHHNR